MVIYSKCDGCGRREKSDYTRGHAMSFSCCRDCKSGGVSIQIGGDEPEWWKEDSRKKDLIAENCMQAIPLAILLFCFGVVINVWFFAAYIPLAALIFFNPRWSKKKGWRFKR